MSLKVKRNNQDLINIYKETILKLQDYCNFFDENKIYYAKDMATALYMLCLEDQNQKSILEQLGKKSELRLQSIIDHSKKNSYQLYSGSPYVHIVLSWNNGVTNFGLRSNTVEHEKKNINTLPFVKWISEPIVSIVNDPLNINNSYSIKKGYKRFEIIKFIRSQDGGSFFDEKIDEEFKKLKDDFIMGYKYKKNGENYLSIPINTSNYLSLESEEKIDFNDYIYYLIRGVTEEFLIASSKIIV